MKIPLFDFQKDALEQMRLKLEAATKFASSDRPQAVAFSAPTGSGKTIMMTALFEAILVEPDDQLDWPLDWEPKRDAVILWISDLPELNEQTRMKIESKSDKVYRVSQLVMIDQFFDQEVLEGGKIYFLNTQKLGTDKLLTKEGDRRQFSIWKTLSNTARALPDRFFVVIDEAHRGMTSGTGAQEAQTLMQRFVLGYPEVGLVRMPLVIGISATPRRFMDLLEQAPHSVHKVIINAADVRLSGLLKNRTVVNHPEVVTTAEMSLLEEAARNWAKMSGMWNDYCTAEGEPVVRPILVVQVENASGTSVTRTNLERAISVIESGIGRRLGEREAAHAIHEAGDIEAGGRTIRKVEASRIEEDPAIGVVFFKTSLSTGWDCPRAEVMMSFRRAEDYTYIAQLLGRMVRSPLARHIDKNAELNDVGVFLPHFDRKTVDTVIEALRNTEEVPPSETGSKRELIVLHRREGSADIFASFSELVTYRVDAARAQKNLRRFLSLSRNLTLDEIDESAWDAAKDQAIGWISAQIKQLRTSGEFERIASTINQVALTSVAVDNSGTSKQGETYVIDASVVDVDRSFEEAGRSLSHGLHLTYWESNADRDRAEVKTEVIAIARDHKSMTAIESSAEAEFNNLYDKHKKSIAKLTEHRRAQYEKLRLATAKPTDVDWRLPDSIDFRRQPTDPEWDRHIFVESDGSFRASLNPWESDVMKEELNNPQVVGWLRNVDRKRWSLEIPYERGGAIRPMYPDLVLIRVDKDQKIVDILEPHDATRDDNFEKARGLARFAERHGALFGRIQLIRKRPSPAGGVSYARLEINAVQMIKELLLITSNRQLDALFDKHAT